MLVIIHEGAKNNVKLIALIKVMYEVIGLSILGGVLCKSIE